jgi:hypothetical protein
MYCCVFTNTCQEELKLHRILPQMLEEAVLSKGGEVTEQ